MADYRRAHVPGGSCFFTVNTYRRQSFLTDANACSVLREVTGTLRLTHPFVTQVVEVVGSNREGNLSAPSALGDSPLNRYDHYGD